ncbi:MAG: protein phosphatase 2C domain-containing protein [Burkholderiaceae bacterium]
MSAVSDINNVLSLSSAMLSEIGGRATNQDRLGTAYEDELACFVVSDGVGGHHGGEIASRIVVDSLLERFSKEALFGERALRSYVDYASVQIAREKLYTPGVSNMSATVAAVLIDRHRRHALFAHLGDTRVYQFRRARLLSCTKDHSLVQQFIDAGYYTPEQLCGHQLRSTLYAAVGIETEARVNLIDAMVRVDSGDAILLCTDGFWEWITDDGMAQALKDAGTVDDWLDRMALVAETASRGSDRERDNASAIAIWLGEPQCAL